MPTPNTAPAPRTQRGSPRMFESDFLERFSHVHPATPAVLYLPLAAFSLYWAHFQNGIGFWRLALELFVGYLVWTLFEYWLHRLLFHMRVVGPKTARAYFFIHGVHHDYPWDRTRLVIPPGASLFLCVVVYGMFRVILGGHDMFGPFAGFVVGYVLYDSVHWYVHARAPKNAFGRWLRREHMVHHFKEPTSRFGVSCPWLDYVFGTRGRPVGARESDASERNAQEQSPEHIPQAS
ncbi:MAG TPA: sterol desaturase family protein [Polyangiaceae bacterium]|nr:sterol desaturase family protein [Polyangiaceae bacterium]